MIGRSLGLISVACGPELCSLVDVIYLKIADYGCPAMFQLWTPSYCCMPLTRHCCQSTVKTDGSIAYDRWKYCLVYNKIGMSYSSMFMHPYIHLSDITISCRCHSSVILPQYFFKLALLHPRQRPGFLLVDI